MNSSLVIDRRKILRAIAEHLEENDCKHSLKEIFSSQTDEDYKKGWKASQADPTSFTDSSAVNSQEDDPPCP